MAFQYNIAAFAQAIMYANQMNVQLESSKLQALSILNRLNIPSDMDISFEIASLKDQLNAMTDRGIEIKSTIESLRNQIESTDSYIASQIRYYIGNESKYLMENDQTFNYYSSSLSKDFSEDDIQFIIKNFKELLYSNTEYGGNQGTPIHDYINGDNNYENIIKNYFPKMTEEEIVDYLNAMNNVGCGYVAVANYIYQAYLNKPDEFEKDFGFPMVYKDNNGKIKTSVNYLFTDIYCYSNKNDIVNGDDKYNFWNLKGRIFSNDPGYSYEGSSKRNVGTYPSDQIKMLESDKYNNSNIELNIIKEYGFTVDNINNYDDLIKKTINDEKVIGLCAINYTLYPVDENNNRDNNLSPYVMINAPHAMTITDVNQNGDYIVSTWGEKYALDPSSLDSTFGIAIVETKEGDDNKNE